MTIEAVPVRFNGVVGMAMRRWYIVVIGMLVTIPLSILAAQHVQPTYTMQAKVVLLVPEKTVGPGGNPYLALGGLDAAVDVVAAGLSSDAVQVRLAATGASSGTIVHDQGTSAPILLVTVVAPTKAEAKAGVTSLVAEVAPTLQAIQRSAGVEQSQLIRSEVIASSKRAVVSFKPLIRAGLMVGLAGVALTFLITALIDSQVARRRRREAEASVDEGTRPRVAGRISPSDTGGEAEGSTRDLMVARGRKR